MSTANHPPLPSAPPEVEPPNEERTRTMTRLRGGGASEDGDSVSTSEASASEISPSEDVTRSGLEALRRPFASLSPQRSAPGPDAETTQAPPSRKVERESRRWSDNTEARRRAGVCSRHGIARSPTGECMLCKKELAASRRSPLPLLVGGALLILGLAAAWLFLF